MNTLEQTSAENNGIDCFVDCDSFMCGLFLKPQYWAGIGVVQRIPGNEWVTDDCKPQVLDLFSMEFWRLKMLKRQKKNCEHILKAQ